MAITETPPPAPTPSPTDPEQHAPGDKEMTLLEHLEELRGRLVAAVLAVVVGVIVAIIPIPGFNSITWLAVDALVAAGKDSGVHFITIRPGEGFFTYLEVALVIGAALAMQVLIFKLLAFVAAAMSVYTH